MPANFDPDLEFPVVVDGVHCKTFEPKHPTMPMDKNWSSHKFGKKWHLHTSSLFQLWRNSCAGREDHTLLGVITILRCLKKTVCSNFYCREAKKPSQMQSTPMLVVAHHAPIQNTNQKQQTHINDAQELGWSHSMDESKVLVFSTKLSGTKKIGCASIKLVLKLYVLLSNTRWRTDHLYLKFNF